MEEKILIDAVKGTFLLDHFFTFLKRSSESTHRVLCLFVRS